MCGFYCAAIIKWQNRNKKENTGLTIPAPNVIAYRTHNISRKEHRRKHANVSGCSPFAFAHLSVSPRNATYIRSCCPQASIPLVRLLVWRPLFSPGAFFAERRGLKLHRRNCPPGPVTLGPWPANARAREKKKKSASYMNRMSLPLRPPIKQTPATLSLVRGARYDSAP